MSDIYHPPSSEAQAYRDAIVKYVLELCPHYLFLCQDRDTIIIRLDNEDFTYSIFIGITINTIGVKLGRYVNMAGVRHDTLESEMTMKWSDLSEPNSLDLIRDFVNKNNFCALTDNSPE